MRDGRLSFCIFLIFSLAVVPVSAQKKLPVVAVCMLDAKNVDDSTARNIENLIFSFLSEQKSFTVLDMRVVENSTKNSDFICRSSLTSEEKAFTLTLTMEKVPYGENSVEQKTVSRSYATYNRILLESRAMIKELLDSDAKIAADSAAKNIPPSSELESQTYKPLLNLTCLSGTWKADCGLERVVIMRTGKAIAIWKNGTSMMLDLFIHNGMLVARQKGPSNPRYFADIPDPVASKIAQTAEPIQWEMHLSEDEKTLSGIKCDLSVVHDGETIVSMKKTTPVSSWTRE